MKKLLFSSLLVLIYAASQAQSFTLVNPVTNYSNSNVSQISQGFLTVHNGASSAKDVKVERTVNTLAPSHTGYFCWDVCYSESTNISSGHLTIQPNTDNNSFYCDIDPHGVAGQDTVCYSFFDASNLADHVDVCLYFDIGSTGISSVNGLPQGALSVASPNPANTMSGISYNADITKNPKLVIYDLLGGKVSEIKLLQKQGTCIVNVSEFRQGIYIYSLIENDKTVATKKLVVAHK